MTTTPGALNTLTPADRCGNHAFTNAAHMEARAELEAQIAEAMASPKSKKVKTVYYGASGSLGDTGVSYFLEFQNQTSSGKQWTLEDKQETPTDGIYDDEIVLGNVDKNKHTSWTIGLSRSLGKGTAVYLEHSNPDMDDTKATTVMGMQVNF